MKRLFVWLASVSMCAAQVVSIGPFATEDWVDERLQVLTNDFATIPYVDDAVGEVEDKIPDVSVYATKSYVNAVSNAIPDVSGFATKSYVDAVSNTIPDISGLATVEYVDAVSNAIPDTSAFSTVEYVNTTSNNLALLIDDLVSEEELGSSVSNIVPAWALVPVPPVTAEVDPAFTNWLATTNVVIDDNFGIFVSNVVPSWALVPIPPVTVEVDPAFTNWLATTNSATVQYVDDHKWTWASITNKPNVLTSETDPSFSAWESLGLYVNPNTDIVVIGNGAYADGDPATAVGKNAKTYGHNTLAVGNNVTASNQFAVAVGVYDTKAIAPYATAVGPYNTASGESSTAVGMWTTAADAYSTSVGYRVTSHGPGTFNINPAGGAAGVWIGETNLATHLDSSSKIALDAIAPAFSASNVYTNGDYVIYDLHLYECTNYTGQAGWRANDWKQTSVAEILGNLRSILDAINGEAL